MLIVEAKGVKTFESVERDLNQEAVRVIFDSANQQKAPMP